MKQSAHSHQRVDGLSGASQEMSVDRPSEGRWDKTGCGKRWQRISRSRHTRDVSRGEQHLGCATLFPSPCCAVCVGRACADRNGWTSSINGLARIARSHIPTLCKGLEARLWKHTSLLSRWLQSLLVAFKWSSIILGLRPIK